MILQERILQLWEVIVAVVVFYFLHSSDYKVVYQECAIVWPGWTFMPDDPVIFLFLFYFFIGLLCMGTPTASKEWPCSKE